MKLYKLIEQDWTTYHGSMKWKLEKINKIKPCKNPTLCSPDVIHAYKNLNLGLLLNPIHANISDPIILECEGNIIVEDYGKCGVFKLLPIKKKQYPKWYKNIDARKDIQILFAILCAEQVLQIFEEKYPDDDRPRKAIGAAKNYLKCKTKDAARAADAAYAAANDAAYDAAYAAAYAANDAAYAAARAADAAYAAANDAAYAAYDAAYAAARAADAAYAAARAADAAYAAANDAAYAAAVDAANAAYAAADLNKINFIEIANQAIKEIMQRYK